MKVELRGITKRFPGVAVRRRGPLRGKRRGPRLARRERGGQVHAHEHPLRALPARRGRDPARRRGHSFRPPADGIAAGIGMVHQHFMLVPVFTVAENVMLGVEPTGPLGRTRTGRGAPPGGRAVRAVRAGGRPRGHHRGPPGGCPAARRDPQGAVPRRPLPHPRRADGGAHAARDHRADGDRPPTGRRRSLGHLHQPQAAGGARHRRRDQRAPQRQGGGHTTPGRDRRAGAGHDDGPRREAGRRAGARRTRPRRRRQPGRRRRPGHRVVDGELRGSAGEIVALAGVATARPSWSRPSPACARPDRGRCGSTAATSPAGRRTTCSAPAWPMCPRTASATADRLVRGFLQPGPQPDRGAALLAAAAHRPPGRPQARRGIPSSSTSAPHRCSSRCRRCRAATSRR